MTPPSSKSETLGIIDWGIGGLGVLREFSSRAPHVPILYWSDTGSTPYGKLSADELTVRLGGIVNELARRGATRVALACNAASTVATRLIHAAIPVHGIIDAGIAAVPVGLRGTIGVVGGARTIRAGLYRRGLSTTHRTIISRIAQPLSAHIEAGRMNHRAFVDDLAAIVRPLHGARAVLLACTHYPAAHAHFAAQLPGTLLIDPAARFADELAAQFSRPSTRRATCEFMTSGAPSAMVASAQRTWAIDVGHATRVRLPAN